MELNFEEWIVEAFLVKRDSKKNISEGEYLTVKKLNVGGDLREKFKDIIKKYLCGEENTFNLNLDQFHDFMSDDTNAKDYKITKDSLAEQNNYFNNLLLKISEEGVDLATDNYADYNYIILKFSKHGQELLYFRKLSRVSVSAKKKFAIHSGKIEEIEGDFIYFDDFIDFIFFKEFLIDGSTDADRKIFCGKILIFNRNNFKTLFRLNEYCITKSTEFFDKFNFIDVADIETEKKDSGGNQIKLKDSFIQDGVLNSQITRIFNLCKDEITFDKIKSLKEQRGDKYGFNVIGTKIRVEDKTQMKDLLDLIDEKIGSPDWAKDKVVRYPSKGENL